MCVLLVAALLLFVVTLLISAGLLSTDTHAKPITIPPAQSAAPDRAVASSSARDHKANAHCKALVHVGMCSELDAFDYPVRRDMEKFCGAGICDGDAERASLEAEEQKHHEHWRRMSLHDILRDDRSLCLAGEQRRMLVETRCADLEDDARLADRGWFLRRGMVPQSELDAMVDLLYTNVEEPVRSSCGASNVHPGECFFPPDDVAKRAPTFTRRLRGMVGEWISRGFHERASLGWPLRLQHQEFIAINPWARKDTSPTCIFRALFFAAAAQPDDLRNGCLNGSLPLADPHPLRLFNTLACWWQSVTRVLSHTAVKRIVQLPTCRRRAPRALAFLREIQFEDAEVRAEIEPR